MAKKKVGSKMVQTTVRLEPEMLREAQYYWSLEGITLTKFVAKQVADFIQEYRKAHPERAPRGKE